MTDSTSLPAVPVSEWSLRLFYIFAFAAGGVIQPFLTLYLAEKGLSGTQIGAIQGWTALLAVLVTPLIGMFTDRTQRHQGVLRVIVFLKGLSAPLMMVSSAYAWLAATVSLRVITAQAQDAIMNRLTLKHLQAKRRLDYGSIRFWGALSFAITSLAAGYAARQASVAVMFPLSALLATAAVFFVGAFPRQLAGRLSASQRQELPPRSPGLRTLFVVVFIFMLGQSGVHTFTSIYLKEDLGADNAFIGLLGAVGSLAPLPAYYLADWLLPRFRAPRVMAAGFGLSALSWSGLYFLQSFQPALFLIALGGCASAIFLVSLVLLLGEFSLPQRAATDQTLVQLTLPGIAGMLAQPLSGWLFDRAGPMVFMADAAFAVLAAGVLLAAQGALHAGPPA